MTFIDGFFLVNFVPFAILAVVGVILFFQSGDASARYYYPLLFVIVTLAYISLWRLVLPLLSRRYAMPTLVPGIIISVFVIILLPGILKYFKIKYANAIVRTAIVILLVACIAKTMRGQEHKTYLREIPEVIKEDCAKHNSKKAVLLVFGDPGGILDCNKIVNVVRIENKIINEKLADIEYQFNLLRGTLDPESLKIQYPHIYLLCVEKASGSFHAAWQKKYGDTPELIFEYIRNKDQTAYRLYKISSMLKSAWLTKQELEELSGHSVDLLDNYNLKKIYKVPNNDKDMSAIRNRGILLNKGNEVWLPEGWRIGDGHGWRTQCSPVTIDIKYADKNNIFSINSSEIIAFYTDTAFNSEKTYLVEIEKQGHVTLYAYCYKLDGKFIKTIMVDDIVGNDQSVRNLISISIAGCGKLRFAIATSGEVSISKIKIIDAGTLTK